MINRAARRIALRELSGGIKGFWVYLACIALGVFAVAAAGAVTEGFSRGLAGEARTLLGGDALFAASQRRATPEELTWMRERGTVSESIGLNVMGESGSTRRQVDLRAVDDLHPLIGAPVLSGGALTFEDALSFKEGAWGIAASPSLLERFNLSIGDRLTLGGLSVEIRAQLDKEADGLGTPGTFSPAATISIAALDAVGRLTNGQLFRARYRLVLDDKSLADELAETSEAAWGVSGLRHRPPEEAVDGLQSLLSTLNSFLAVIGIAALIAGGVGVAQASSSFLESRTGSIAAFKSLGADAATIRAAYLMQLGLLAAIGALIGIAAGGATPLLLDAFFGNQIPLPNVLALYPWPLARAGILGVLTAIMFALPALGRARATSPAALFRRLADDEKVNVPLLERLLSGVAAIALVAFAVFTSEEQFVTGALLLGAGGTWGLLRGLASLVRRAARASAHERAGMARLTLSNLGGPGSLAPTIAPALGLGLALLITVVSVQANLLRQINETATANLPSLFFSQIPNEKAEIFDTTLAAEGVDIADPEAFRRTPLILGRVTALKGEPISEDNVAPSERWVIDGELGMPYIADAPPELEIVDGEWWPADYSGPLLASMEADAAQGLDLAVGDQLGLRIFGRDFTATLASTRIIDWGGFGANAAIILSPGTLEAANPQNLAIAQTDPQQDAAIIAALGRVLPEVVVFQTRDALQTAGELLASLALAVNAAAGLVTLSGLLVLFGAFAAMARARRGEAALLKTFGATRGSILGLYAAEFGLIAAVTALIGAIIGVSAAYPIVVNLFEAVWHFPWSPILTVTTIAIATAAIGGAFVGITTLAQPPARVLRSG